MTRSRAKCLVNFTEAIPLCDIISIYIQVIHNNSKTHKFKYYKLVVRGNMVYTTYNTSRCDALFP